jgi:hypothetical protein
MYSKYQAAQTIAKPIAFGLIKGTGEASPVRGGDWAGFKFGADRAAV